MIDIEVAIQKVRNLLNVQSVKSLVAEIIAGEPAQAKYNSLANAKSKFIVVNSLPISFSSVQKGVVNINMYVPKTVSGTPDYLALKQILLAVKPLVEDAGDGVFYCYVDEKSTLSLLEEPSINYNFYNLRVQVVGFNIEKQTNFIT